MNEDFSPTHWLAGCLGRPWNELCYVKSELVNLKFVPLTSLFAERWSVKCKQQPNWMASEGQRWMNALHLSSQNRLRFHGCKVNDTKILQHTRAQWNQCKHTHSVSMRSFKETLRAAIEDPVEAYLISTTSFWLCTTGDRVFAQISPPNLLFVTTVQPNLRRAGEVWEVCHHARLLSSSRWQQICRSGSPNTLYFFHSR